LSCDDYRAKQAPNKVPFGHACAARTADDGAIALELVRCLQPDVALLDEDMSSFGGAAVARILKSELSEVRVVVMTRTVTRAGR
jgi:DNA-binding NarL/FixJ family response regulator